GFAGPRYTDSATKGFATVRAGVATYWPDRGERITGIPVAELYETVEALATARTAMILTARGAEAQLGHRHRAGFHQSRSGTRLAGEARFGIRNDHRPRQRPGWPGARPES